MNIALHGTTTHAFMSHYIVQHLVTIATHRPELTGCEVQLLLIEQVTAELAVLLMVGLFDLYYAADLLHVGMH